MSMDMHDVIKRPLHTEKSVRDIHEGNAYHFEVNHRATKNDVRRAIEGLFPNVRVVAVKTLWGRGKQHRTRWGLSRTRDQKKAIVKLRAGDTIDIGY